MNKNNHKFDSFDNFRPCEPNHPDKFQTPNQNINFGIWKQDILDINPFYILTPSPFNNLPFPTPLQQHKTKRFQDWSLSAMCQNPNVNRNMEIMIQNKLNFNSDEESSIENSSPKRQTQIENQFVDDENDELFKIHQQLKEKKQRPKDKGLRRLSEKSFEIVKILGSTTYKEVAIKLIDELEHLGEILRQEKQQQNIKRRVYDALNVLIALGILRKERRLIIYDQKKNKVQKKNKELLDKYDQQLKSKEATLKKKKEQLKYLRQQYHMQQLILRNKFSQSKDKINLPFLAIKAPQGQEKWPIEVESRQKIRIKKVKRDHCQQSQNLLQYVKNLIYIIH